MSKPVAWMYQIHDITGWTWVIDQQLPDYEYRNEKPLYTHPHSEESVKVKQLSDEEIHKIAQEHFHAGLGINPLDFARAIIKEITE